jgi:hypothetical protein
MLGDLINVYCFIIFVSQREATFVTLVPNSPYNFLLQDLLKCCNNNERPTGKKHTNVGWDDGGK